MGDFTACLMPYSFMRRWDYTELIPVLVYFDNITFLMDDIEAPFLFTIPYKGSSDLDSRKFPAVLREEFSTHKISLSKNPEVTVVNPSSLWKIKNGDQRYQLTKESDKLFIYASPETLLIDPKQLTGMDDNELADRLTVGQHRYYWPMRDLFREEVIYVTGMDMSNPFPKASPNLIEALYQDESTAQLVDELFIKEKVLQGFEFLQAENWYTLKKNTSEIEALLNIKSAAEHAKQFVNYASRHYNSVNPYNEDISDKVKATAVLTWIRDALKIRSGWAQVALNRDGFNALMYAEALGDYLGLITNRDVKFSEPTYEDDLVPLPPKTSYAAVRVIGQLLKEELSHFALKDKEDPDALSEVLEVREKYKNELHAFRTEIINASNNIRSETTREFIFKIDEYVRQVKPVYAEIKKALSNPWRRSKLIFKNGGIITLTAMTASLGALVGDLAGAMSGAFVGKALPEFLKLLKKQSGNELVKPLKQSQIPTGKSMVYLFQVQKALKK